MTPEGKVKMKVSQTLIERGTSVYYHMPVPGGYGVTTLDYVGVFAGKFFAIETKKLGGKPTDRQLLIIQMIEAAGGRVFVIDGPTGIIELRKWLGLV